MGNLLYLVHRLPYPPNKGDKVRSFHLLKHLAASHRVFLGTFVDDPADEVHVATVQAFCAEIHAARLNPLSARLRSLAGLCVGQALTMHYYRNQGLGRWVSQVTKNNKIDAIVVFSSAMGQYADGLNQLPMLVDFVDVDSAKWMQYAANHRWPMSWLYKREGRRLLEYERGLASRARRSFFVTESETALFRQLAPESASAVEAMSNGVDADYYSPDPSCISPFPPSEPLNAQIPLVFTGAMDYWPNIDAVNWFVHDMLPELRLSWPQLCFYIVGRNPPPAVLALAGDSVVVTGTVPDVRPYLQHAAVVVAPLRIARGIQNKILEAMAMARPVVASRSCVDAIDALSGSELISAETAEDFVAQVDSLLRSPKKAAAVGNGGASESAAKLQLVGPSGRHRSLPESVDRSRCNRSPSKTVHVMTSNVYANARQPWRRAGPVFLLLLAWVIFLYRDTAAAMVTIWLRSDTFTHCFVVPPIVVWLVWRQRDAVFTQIPRPNILALILLVGVALGWLLGDLAAMNALTQLAFVSMIVLLVPAVLGVAVARTIIFPLGFLFFSVPIGEFVMPQFMVWTADFTVLALRLSGIPVYREGLQFVIPSGNWSVVQACSGVRYLIASLTVGTLFAYLNYRSFRRRAIFMGVSILVPVLANWVRAYMIVMLGHLSGNKLATGVDHLIYGWVFFGIVIMLMFMIGARWAEPDADRTATMNGLSGDAHATSTAMLLVTAATAILLVALPIIARIAINKADSASVPQLVVPPSLAADWTASQERLIDWKPAFKNPSAEVNVTFKRETRAVGLYIGYYRQQDYDHKLVSSDNVLVQLEDRQWVQVSGGARNVNFSGKPTTLRAGELRGSSTPGHQDGERLVIWQIYWINGTWTASDTLAKAYGALYRLLGRGDDSAVVIMYVPKDQAVESDATLDSFVHANAAAIDSLLQQTRARR